MTDFAEWYRRGVFALFLFGLWLLRRHGILTLSALWSRSQYYTITTILLFFFYETAVCLRADFPFLYTADCRYLMAASLYTLFILYHRLVAPGAIATHRLNDISYEHYSFYNFIFHYIVPQLMLADWLFLTDTAEAHWEMVFLWLLYPALYVVFVYVRAWLTIRFHGKSNLYPYLFMDPTLRTKREIAIAVAKLGVHYFTIGLLVFCAGKIVGS